MFKQGLVLAAFTFLIATAARSGISFQEAFCPYAPAQLVVGNIAVVTISEANNLNLRTQPGVDQAILARIPKDASVTVVGGPTCKDGYRWYEVSFKGYVGWSIETGPEGLYSLYPVGTSFDGGRVNQSTDQSQPFQEQPVNTPVQVSQPQPVTVHQLWCAIFPQFCADEVQSGTWEFQKYQCTWYAAVKRPDAYDWLPVYGANAKDWADIAVQNQIPVSSASAPDFAVDYDHVHSGDLVVLQPSCAGADVNYGHVAYVESVDYSNGIIHVSEYNALYPDNYDERDLYVYWCMSFIH